MPQLRAWSRPALQLEPDNPLSHYAAAFSMPWNPAETGVTSAMDSARVPAFMRAHDSAQRQRRHVLAVVACSLAVSNCINMPGNYLIGEQKVLNSLTQATMAKLESAVAALEQVRRVLPETWVGSATTLGRRFMAASPAVRILRSGEDRGPASPPTDPREVCDKHVRAESTICSGCNKYAAGLRKCSRSRKMGYCR